MVEVYFFLATPILLLVMEDMLVLLAILPTDMVELFILLKMITHHYDMMNIIT